MALPPVSDGTLVVFAIIAVALVAFVSEVVPNDITAIGVLVALVVLEPLTGVGPEEGIAGFANPATVTIMAMYILSEGVQQTGIVQLLGVYIGRVTGNSETRLLGATIGTTATAAGLINNTPVVAVFIPMVQRLADRTHRSPSKLLLPLSYAAMLGGTLTLVGTSTNLLASDLARRLVGEPLSMFEFTPLGVVVLLVGGLYLLTIGRRLVPARIPPLAGFLEEFELEDHVARLRVREGSPLAGRSVEGAFEGVALDVDLLQVTRGRETFLATYTDEQLQVGDRLVVRATPEVREAFAREYELGRFRQDVVTDEDLSAAASRGRLVEMYVPEGSNLSGETLRSSNFRQRYNGTVLAIRRGDQVFHEEIADRPLERGDLLLLQSTESSIERFVRNSNLLISQHYIDLFPEYETEHGVELSPRTPVALAILFGVIATAALNLLPISIAALGGVVAMVSTGCLTTTDAYDAVSWNVIFLLAGVIPLGLAMQATGGDQFVSALFLEVGAFVPPLALLGLFYLLTSLLANVITPTATIVLMAPIAVSTAESVGATKLSFLLAVMFACNSALMTPIGYQTNLMVYGPGGYRFTDFLRVGAPLQLVLTVVVTLGIALYWGV
jgi:di/tricarboxylate transporter